MTFTNIIMLVTIILYLMLMIWIGVRFSRKTSGVDDFYLGGRRLGPLTVAMSAEASDMSSWLLLGVPGLAYICGIADAAWTCIGLLVGTYLNWLIVARRLRAYTERINAITLPEYFSRRWHDDQNILGLIASLVIIIFFIPYTASGFKACGKLFESLFGMNYTAAMLLSAFVIIVYTVLGGFHAVSTTDLIQSIIMIMALLVVLIFGICTAGGFNAVIDNAKSLPGYLSMTASHDAVSATSSPYGFLTIISTLAWGLGYFGMPHVLLRFMAIKDAKKLTMSRRIATGWVLISMFAAILIGLVGNAIAKTGAIPVWTSTSESETLIIRIAYLIGQNGWLAAIVGGLILAGVLAATMSTADSQLLAASSSVTEDICRRFLNVDLDNKKSMIIARLSVVVISLIAVFLASDPNSSVFNIVSFAWAGFGAAFAPPVLFSLFWKRSTKKGALAGMVAGGAVVFIWKYVVRPMGGVWNIYELLPAFIAGCIAIVVFSLLDKAPSKEIINEFEDARAAR